MKFLRHSVLGHGPEWDTDKQTATLRDTTPQSKCLTIRELTVGYEDRQSIKGRLHERRGGIRQMHTLGITFASFMQMSFVDKNA